MNKLSDQPLFIVLCRRDDMIQARLILTFQATDAIWSAPVTNWATINTIDIDTSQAFWAQPFSFFFTAQTVNWKNTFCNKSTSYRQDRHTKQPI
jgi:hypothetical protein